MMSDFFNAVRGFLMEYLPNQRCFSENTICSYRQALNLFVQYLRTEQKLSVKQIRFRQKHNFRILRLVGKCAQLWC